MFTIYTSIIFSEPPTRPAVSLTDKEMLPSTPCVYVQNSQEAFSPQLLDICLKRPIVLVRNLANACGMDLGLYTTKKLVEMHPNHPVEIRSQMEQTSGNLMSFCGLFFFDLRFEIALLFKIFLEFIYSEKATKNWWNLQIWFEIPSSVKTIL